MTVVAAMRAIQKCLEREHVADQDVDMHDRGTVVALIAARTATTTALGILADVLIDQERRS